MKINNGLENFTQTNFKARLKNNELLSDVLKYMDDDDKDAFNKALNTFAHVATDDVVELRKTNENNSDVYSLVNTKNDKKSVLVCRTFPNVICEDDSPEEYRRKHFEKGYIREALIDTLKEASNKCSNAFLALFGDKSDFGNRLPKYFI